MKKYMESTIENWRAATTPCRKCGKDGCVNYLIVESSDGAHEDINYHCTKCNANWWVMRRPVDL